MAIIGLIFLHLAVTLLSHAETRIRLSLKHEAFMKNHAKIFGPLRFSN